MNDTTVRAGQTWRYNLSGVLKGRDVTVLEVRPDGRVMLQWPSHTDSHWEVQDFSDGKCWTLVSDAPAEVKPVERDWTPWLPPHALPDTGPNEFKAGQVWASFERGPSVFRVLRVTHASGDNGAYQGLAGRKLSEFVSGGPFSRRCILVQDVGEPEPRDPRVLYGEVSGSRKEGAVTGNPLPRGSGTVPPPPSGTHACRLGVACTHHYPPPSAPWAFMTDFDLLPDAP